MSTATLRIAYEGPALAGGRMEVRDLAPALFALGSALEEANQVINGKESAVRVYVRAEFTPGSFDVALDITQGFWGTLFALFSTTQYAGAANLIQILGFGKTTGISVIGVMKKLRGRKPKQPVLVDLGGNIILEIDNEKVSLSAKTYNTFNDPKVREAIYATMRPLAVDGIDEISAIEGAGRKAEKIVIATKDDLPALMAPLPTLDQIDQEISSSTGPMALTVIAPNFREGNKWRFFDGQNTINAEMADPVFLQRLSSHEESFAKDDILICDVTTRQYAGPTGLRAEHIITRVADHRHQPTQMSLMPGSGEKK